jgi:hypothetical protein
VLAAARLPAPPPGARLRRALSLDAGVEAAREQAGLEAALERIALAHPPPPSDTLCFDGDGFDAASARSGPSGAPSPLPPAPPARGQECDDAGSTTGACTAPKVAWQQAAAGGDDGDQAECPGGSSAPVTAAAAATAGRWAAGGLLAAQG